jgi:hypothetical protein
MSWEEYAPVDNIDGEEGRKILAMRESGDDDTEDIRSMMF